MQINLKFKDDVPLTMATHLVNELGQQATMFGAVTEVLIQFDEGEEERMIDVERNRVPRIG